jgi:hypothetical protein
MGACAFSVAAVLAGFAIGPRLLASEQGSDPQEPIVASTPWLPATPSQADQVGTAEFGRVVRPGLAVVRANGLTGRWTIEVDGSGDMRLRTPSSFDGQRSWRLDVAGDGLTTSAFADGLCQGISPGTYRWTRVDRFLILDWISDDCDARAWILTSRPWRELS